MKNKKITAILLSLVLSFSISACGSVENSVETESTVMNEETEEKEESESTEEETETETSKESEIETAPTKESESKEETETTKESESKEETKTVESKEETKPIETPTPTETPKHMHSYTSTDSLSSCVSPGVRTYVCSCGDSYTEDLGYGAHDFSVPIYESVFHDEVWQTTPRTIKVTIIHCSCGYSTTSEDEFQNHCVERINAGYLGCGMSDWYETKNETVYDQVKISDSYTSEEIVGYKCSICGQQSN